MEEKHVSIINKSVSSSDNSPGNITDEIELINKFTRRKFKKEEVYIFSVILCDNEIDRQNEKFSDEALFKLAKLFVGKTGIMDHDIKSNNQTARIFSCEVQSSKDKFSSEGNTYKCLKAKAYMPITEKNKEIITAIDSGIKKEVSINCSVENIVCSVCGSNIKTGTCGHIKGRKYKKGNSEVICHYILDNPIDAYEWSFVVVPAQRKAGVIKSFNLQRNGSEIILQDILKKLSEGEAINLNEIQSSELYDMVKSLENKAKIGEEYFNELKNEVMKLSVSAQPEIDNEIMKNIINKMSLNELKSFRDAYKKKILKNSKLQSQLSRCIEENPINTQFKI